MAVEQICALASDRFAYEKLLTAGFVGGKGGGVELNVIEMGDFAAEIIGKTNSVAGGNGGVCGIAVDLSDSAGGEHDIGRGDDLSLSVLENIGKKSAVKSLEIEKHRKFRNFDVVALFDRLAKAVGNFIAGGVLVVDYSAAACDHPSRVELSAPSAVLSKSTSNSS